MRNFLKETAMAVTAMGLAAGTVSIAYAHHAVNSQFNTNVNSVYTGVMEKFDLANPHSYVFMVRMVNGQPQHWAFETLAPNALHRAGLSARDAWKIGETYTLVYSPALDGSYTGIMQGMKLLDGRFVAVSAKENIDAAKELLKLLGNEPQGSQPQASQQK